MQHKPANSKSLLHSERQAPARRMCKSWRFATPQQDRLQHTTAHWLYPSQTSPQLITCITTHIPRSQSWNALQLLEPLPHTRLLVLQHKQMWGNRPTPAAPPKPVVTRRCNVQWKLETSVTFCQALCIDPVPTFPTSMRASASAKPFAASMSPPLRIPMLTAAYFDIFAYPSTACQEILL